MADAAVLCRRIGALRRRLMRKAGQAEGQCDLLVTACDPPCVYFVREQECQGRQRWLVAAVAWIGRTPPSTRTRPVDEFDYRHRHLHDRHHKGCHLKHSFDLPVDRSPQESSDGRQLRRRWEATL